MKFPFKNLKLIIISQLAIIIILALSLTYSIKLAEQPKQAYNLWNAKLAETYPDEPKFNDISKDATASAWFIPSDPKVIASPLVEQFPIDRLFEDSSGLSEEDWEDYPASKELLDEQNLDKRYYDYFIQKGRVPASGLTRSVDINGDGFKDKVFQGRRLGCASCHTTYIDIFINDKTYPTFSNKGLLYARTDNKGFYIENEFWGNDYAACCTDNTVVSKYEWNGDGFTEIARRKVFF